MNKENFDTNPLIFRTKPRSLIVGAILSLFIFVPWGVRMFMESSIQRNDILSGKIGLSFVAYILLIMYCVLSYFASKKSYIEITDTHLIIVKPMHNPFPTMENLTILYSDIQLFKINLQRDGYCAYIQVKEDFGKSKTIRLPYLKDAKKLNEELSKKGVNVEFDSFGWNTPPKV